MSFQLGEKLSNLFNALHTGSLTADSEGLHPDIIECALDRVIEGTDAKIRLVPAYKRKLWRAIESSVSYADHLVDHLPEAIYVDKNSFSSNPYINAFFVNPQDMLQAVIHSSELKEFFSEPENRNLDECHAFLCMQKIEKNILGSELVGDQVVRDVPQTSVSFTDHRLYSPATTEEQIRLDMRCCFFEGLITNALAEIMECRAQRHHLEAQHRRLMVKARNHTDEALRKELAETERQLDELGYITPQVCLEKVLDVFSKPERFIKLQQISMAIDKVGIKVEGDSNRPSNQLELTEVTINSRNPRIVVLTRIKREDWLH
ncbi:MAG: hypothetical protein ABW072_00040 [Sedimenticola sp.]